MKGVAILAVGVITGVAIIGIIGVTMISGSESTSQHWQVIKDNVTVTGKMAFVVTCNVFAAGCPPECCTSINNIQLIKYQDTYYYVRNVALPANPGPETTITSTEAVAVW
jgi:hypothetical protein